MATQKGNLDLATVEPGGCFARWSAAVPCPNAWTGVVETIGKPGYGQFCAAHMDGYRAFNRGGEGVSYRVWDRAEWEASGRGKEHDAALAVPSTGGRDNG